MIGDRSHDIEGAPVHGIDCVAITWGCALPGEPASARQALTWTTPRQVAAALGVDLGAQAS